MNGMYEAETTEAIAVEEGVLLARERELNQVIIKSDSLSSSRCQYKLKHWRTGINYSRNHRLAKGFWKLENEASEKGIQQGCT